MLNRWSVIGASAFVLFLTACAQTPAQVNNSANDLFEKAQTEETPGAALDAYEESLDAYEEAQGKRTGEGRAVLQRR